MKTLWCWRCKMELPMLDEAEFAELAVVHQRAVEAVKDFREEHPVPLKDVPLRGLLMPVCEAYTELTGFPETNADAVMHHRISLYGTPCPECMKPFRTPMASFCAECGYRPSSSQDDLQSGSSDTRSVP